MAHPYRTPMQIESIDQPVDNRTLTRPIRTKNDYLQFIISFDRIFEWIADSEFCILEASFELTVCALSESIDDRKIRILNNALNRLARVKDDVVVPLLTKER